jgi:hypothetical protein
MKPRNKGLVKKWVEALRSGKYQQGRSSLRAKGIPIALAQDKFCCLGVLCDVIDSERWKGCQWEGKDGYLPSETCRKIGLSQHTMRELVDMNDSHKVSFDTIATFLTEHFELRDD